MTRRLDDGNAHRVSWRCSTVTSFLFVSFLRLSVGHAADLGPWDETLGPATHSSLGSSSSFRRSRARILQDDVACFPDRDLDHKNDRSTEAIMDEARGTVTGDHSTYPDSRIDINDGRLQLALSGKDDPTPTSNIPESLISKQNFAF